MSRPHRCRRWSSSRRHPSRTPQEYAGGQDDPQLRHRRPERRLLADLGPRRAREPAVRAEQLSRPRQQQAGHRPRGALRTGRLPRAGREGHHGRLRRERASATSAASRCSPRTRAGYGECRSGVTQQEAEYGPRGSRNGPDLPAARPRRGPEPGAQRPALLGLQRRSRLRKRLRRRRLLRLARTVTN